MVTAKERPDHLLIIGDPVAHSLSPLIQGAALAASSIPVSYKRLAVPPEGLLEALERCRQHRAGGNVTVPHKESVAVAASSLSEAAARLGAVNTFWFESGRLCGHNTDVHGALATLIPLMGGRIDTRCPDRPVLLGGGGSAAAVLLALAELGVSKVAVIARSPGRAQSLLSRIGLSGKVFDAQSEPADHILSSADLIVNCTPLGLGVGDPLPANPARFASDAAVFDLVYANATDTTPFVAAARRLGLKAEDGLRMLVEQGAAAFETWFGIPAPRRLMWEALRGRIPSADEVRA